jgi:hypothetical protein
MNINHCGYNDHGIRISVIFPFEDGWAVAGVHEGWTTHSPLRKFATVEAAKNNVAFRKSATRITWKEEPV